MFLHIIEAKYLEEYKIEVLFSDGKKGVADLKDAFHGPAFQHLNDAGYFSRFAVDDELKTIVWPNGVDLSPEYLYFRAFSDDPELQSQFVRWGFRESAEQAA